ncbi:gephyrin-like molybdotransferase Glp [Bradyrhizobium genosp. P]|uniref:molybdopterin molybdotransferase MoeA n=1 Tax=Bradyrhizobium genosp. P TaxID=83641 RepID=UPI003CEF7494
MNVRPDLATARAFDDCLAHATLMSPTVARGVVLDGVGEIAGTETTLLTGLLGRVAATDILSEVALPRFDNSAVDGFALHADDLRRPSPLTLKIVGKTAAGHTMAGTLRPGNTVRILTGARVPDGAAAIVLEERSTRHLAGVTFHFLPDYGANIRGRGEDVSTGTIVVAKGTVFDGRHIAILAASGNARACTKRKLRVGVLSTGDELIEAGNEVGPNSIVDTNGPMLRSLLTSEAIAVSDLGIVPDEREAVARTMLDAASHLDLLITSGGVAGSDADHVAGAIIDAGGRCETLKLALRPGKPIGRGSVGRMQVLALPGNPVAALVNFLLFGRPLIRRMLGATEVSTMQYSARTAESFVHKVGRTEFVLAKVDGFGPDGIVRIGKLGRGGSARLLPLVNADGFAEIGAELGNVAENSLVNYHPFSMPLAL